MQKLVIFGTGKIAEVAYHCFEKDSEYDVVAFTCDEAFRKTDVWYGHPVISFEEIEKKFPPQHYFLFIAVGYHELNRLRFIKFLEAKKKGYQLVSYFSSRADISASSVLGENCFIGSQTTIEPCVKLGHNVICWSHVLVGHHSEIGSHVWLAAGATLGGGVSVGDYGFLGLNSTVTQEVKIETHCFIGANALVNKNLSHDSVVIARETECLRLNAYEFFKISKLFR